jgi:hypothetical protein
MSLNLHNITNPLKRRIQEQIAKYMTADDSVVQDSNANDMRVTQDLNSFGEIMRNVQLMKTKIYIFRVYHLRIIGEKIGSRHMKQTDSPIIILRNMCVLTGCFDLCLNYLPFWNLAFKGRHLFLMLICFIDIFCNDKTICNAFIVFKHWQPSWNEIWRIKIITIPLSRWRMFYIILNVYIFNSFKEPLAIKSMAYLV